MASLAETGLCSRMWLYIDLALPSSLQLHVHIVGTKMGAARGRSGYEVHRAQHYDLCWRLHCGAAPSQRLRQSFKDGVGGDKMRSLDTLLFVFFVLAFSAAAGRV